jgi:hypothetical protein
MFDKDRILRAAAAAVAAFVFSAAAIGTAVGPAEIGLDQTPVYAAHSFEAAAHG